MDNLLLIFRMRSKSSTASRVISARLMYKIHTNRVSTTIEFKVSVRVSSSIRWIMFLSTLTWLISPSRRSLWSLIGSPNTKASIISMASVKLNKSALVIVNPKVSEKLEFCPSHRTTSTGWQSTCANNYTWYWSKSQDKTKIVIK